MICSKPSKGIKELCQHMIDNPHEWKQGTYEFYCPSKGIMIWTANGLIFMDINNSNCLNLREKLLISSSIKKSVANRFLEINKK